MVKIAVNTRLLVEGKLDGIGYFSYEILRRLVHLFPQHEFIFLFDRKINPKFLFAPNVKGVSIAPQARHPFLYYIWFHLSLKRWLSKHKPDVFFSPEGYLCPGSHVPQINVIHDLNFEHYPKDLPWLERWYYKTFFPRYAEKANHIVTVSEFSAKDIVNKYGIASEKITIVYNGLREIFRPEKSTDTQAYFLHIGTLHPRKNVLGIIRAFDAFKSKHSGNDKLYFAGRKKWWTAEMQAAFNASPYKNDIIFLGRVSSEKMVSLLSGATALLNFSNFEGFGVPLLEAMACGCPVICSDIEVFKEVCSDAALYVDQNDANSAAKAFQLIKEPELRERMEQKGKERSTLFNWDESAQKIGELLLRYE